MVASAEEICNLALAKIGHEGFITSLTEDSKGARYMNVFYEPMRDAVLRQFLWRFARKRAVLAPLVEEPAFVNYSSENYFQYPDDCLRIVGTDQSFFEAGVPWGREGDKIIAADNVLNIVYIRRVEDPAYFDPSFVDVLANRLAMEAAMPVTKDRGMRDQMQKDYDKSVIRAAHCSAVEQSGEKFIAEAFLQVR